MKRIYHMGGQDSIEYRIIYFSHGSKSALPAIIEETVELLRSLL